MSILTSLNGVRRRRVRALLKQAMNTPIRERPPTSELPGNRLDTEATEPPPSATTPGPAPLPQPLLGPGPWFRAITEYQSWGR